MRCKVKEDLGKIKGELYIIVCEEWAGLPAVLFFSSLCLLVLFQGRKLNEL